MISAFFVVGIMLTAFLVLFALIIIILAERKNKGVFPISLVLLVIILYTGINIGSRDYADLTLLEEGRAFEILAVTECPENNVCFILGSEIAGTKYYKTDKNNVDETVESGDIVYTKDGMLKLYRRKNDSSLEPLKNQP